MANGNFLPFAGRSGPFVGVLPSKVEPAQPLSCNGSPEGVVPGNPGQTCVNLLNGDLYLKLQGTQMIGWQLVGVSGGGGGGGGGNQQIFIYNGNPNGHVALTGPGMVIDTSVSPSNIWIKQTNGASNSDWVLLIGG